MSETYNGWTNRETWLVHLHLSNDKALDDEAHAVVYAARKDWAPPVGMGDLYDDERTSSARRYAASRAVQEYVDEFLTELVDDSTRPESLDSLLLRDLVSTCIARVDWLEVADAFTPENDQ